MLDLGQAKTLLGDQPSGAILVFKLGPIWRKTGSGEWSAHSNTWVSSNGDDLALVIEGDYNDWCLY